VTTDQLSATSPVSLPITLCWLDFKLIQTLKVELFWYGVEHSSECRSRFVPRLRALLVVAENSRLVAVKKPRMDGTLDGWFRRRPKKHGDDAETEGFCRCLNEKTN
jgi:hypothetical protein